MNAWKIKTLVLLAICWPGLALAADEDLDKLDEEVDKLFYYLGTSIERSLEPLSLTDAEKQQVLKGLQAAFDGTAERLDDSEYGPLISELGNKRIAAAAARELSASDAYLKEMAAETGAIQTSSGLVYQELEAGTGDQPTAASAIRAHYHGTLRDGTVFDSSVERGEPLTIGLGQVIPCWTEGIALMRVGGKARLSCPADIAYGERGQGAIPPNAALTFEVELLDIIVETAG